MHFPNKLSFPGDSDCQESTCNAGDLGSIPGLGRSPGEGNSYPLQYSCSENSMDREAWQATAHWVAERQDEGTFTHLRHQSYQSPSFQGQVTQNRDVKGLASGHRATKQQVGDINEKIESKAFQYCIIQHRKQVSYPSRITTQKEVYNHWCFR